MIDMTKLWEYLDTQAQNLPVPKSHENSIVDIFCNDCFKVQSKIEYIFRKCNSFSFIDVECPFFVAINGEIPFYWIEMC